jgi:hypothetical protein
MIVISFVLLIIIPSLHREVCESRDFGAHYDILGL